VTLLALALLGRHFRRSHHRCYHTRTSNHHRQYSIVVKQPPRRKHRATYKTQIRVGVFPALGFSSPHARERAMPRARARARANAPFTARTTRYKFKSHHPPLARALPRRATTHDDDDDDDDDDVRGVITHDIRIASLEWHTRARHTHRRWTHHISQAWVAARRRYR